MKRNMAATGIGTALTALHLSAVQASATTPTDAAAILNAAGSNESIAKIGNVAKGVINSVYIGAVGIGVIICVISLIVGLIRIGIHKSSQKRDIGKDSIIWACIALFLIGGAVALIGAALQIGANARM